MPTTPNWNVAALVEHVGQTQHWVAEILERRVSDPTQLPTQMEPMPSDPQAWPDWLSESASRVAGAASQATLEATVWNAAGDERTGGQFWLHSLLNEAVIHGFDAVAAATGDAAAAADSYELDPDVAAELVTNHLTMLTSPTWAAQRSNSAEALRGNGQTLHWRATDESSLDWNVERQPQGAQRKPGIGTADVVVSGPAKSLLLILTRRLPPINGEPEAVTIDGDVDLVRHWIQHTAHDAG